MISNPADITRFLHEKIPLARAMDARVESIGAKGLVITAPMKANHNHLGTAFGGSIAALATLAGYAMLWQALGDRDAHVVIRDSQMGFRHPVTGTLRAVCPQPDETELKKFRARFARAGKARITLRVTLEENERVCVSFTGTYVAIRGMTPLSG